jgi:pSer/pThr/pTyr-binding forkhead associated (FHA) protein
VLNGPLQGSKLPLLEGRTTLGRDETNRIVVLDEKASSHHAVIVGQAGRFAVEDVGSTNGTFVDEQRLAGSHPLRSGERVRLGGTGFLFRGEA